MVLRFKAKKKAAERAAKKKTHVVAKKKAKTTIIKMKKKGATDADCKDLAVTDCKMIEKERRSDVSLLKKLKSGKHCVTKGQREVRIARARYLKTKRTWLGWKKKVTIASKATVTISSQSYDTLTRGKCGFVFSSRSYISAHYRYRRAVKIELQWRGSVTETRKAYYLQIRIAKRKVKNCRCYTKATRDKTWKFVSSTVRVSKQVKGYAKCKMMQCVLNGTPLSSGKCKGTLTKLVKTRLDRSTELIKGCSHKRRLSFKRRVIRKTYRL